MKERETDGQRERLREIRKHTHSFRFGGGMNETYKGKTEARGIACDLWVFSGPIPDLKIKEANILWYFADPERWSPAVGKSKIPVRSQWYGKKLDDAGEECCRLTS